MRNGLLLDLAGRQWLLVLDLGWASELEGVAHVVHEGSILATSCQQSPNWATVPLPVKLSSMQSYCCELVCQGEDFRFRASGPK